MTILIKYSDSSHRDASDGTFCGQFAFRSKFPIFRPQTMGYSLTFFFAKLEKF